AVHDGRAVQLVAYADSLSWRRRRWAVYWHSKAELPPRGRAGCRRLRPSARRDRRAGGIVAVVEHHRHPPGRSLWRWTGEAEAGERDVERHRPAAVVAVVVRGVAAPAGQGRE